MSKEKIKTLNSEIRRVLPIIENTQIIGHKKGTKFYVKRGQSYIVDLLDGQEEIRTLSFRIWKMLDGDAGIEVL